MDNLDGVEHNFDGHIYENIRSRDDMNESRFRRNSGDMCGDVLIDEGYRMPRVLDSFKYKPKLILPHYGGSVKENVEHYSVKISVYVNNYNIDLRQERINVFKCILSNEALDLFLSLSYEKQGDIESLRGVFINYFEPRKHRFLRLAEFLKYSKGIDERMPSYYLRLCRYAQRYDIDTEILKAVFVVGLPLEFQQHIALQGVSDLEEIYETGLQF